MTSENPAAAQGWIQSTDPKTGRVFYANHITRKTQWDPPEGWVDVQAPPALAPPASEEAEEPLPANWEVMHDPTTGKPFYVDHERKITTWTRPKAEKKTHKVSFQPAVATPPTSGNAAALARILAAQEYHQQPARSYQQEASYYSSPTSSSDVDLSDSMPQLDFSVKKVADALRPECPHCNAVFTMSKRRHHCRLCGDVFCDACSAHRVTLPLDGPEFEKPVRICDFCNEDVEQGNFFSMRRYLTPLHLYNPGDREEEEGGVATIANVNAALSALTQDLDQMVQSNPAGSFEKITIPPSILVPEIVKHLTDRSTSDRAIRAVASLLSLESLAGKEAFAVAVYLHGRQATLEAILSILERSGSDRKTLFVQEQAARVVFYLTEAKTVAAVNRAAAEAGGGGEEEGVEALDLQRAVRSVLDLSSASRNPNLQRWSAACIKNLVIEDQRRACLSINDVAAAVASGEPPSSPKYQSFLDELISTGGVMILCTLIGTDDADTRAHAVGALGATLTSCRAVDASLVTLAEMTGGISGRMQSKDGDIVRAIVAGGGCGSSVSQLLLSADNSVAGMGCAFLSSLVMPLLSDPKASMSLPSQYDYRTDQDGVGACREASVEIATDSCLPALLSLVRENGRIKRSIELRKLAMETLAAVSMSIGEMGKAWARGQYEEGLELSGAPAKLKDAVLMMNEEGVIDGALEVLQSSSGQSLGSSRETHASRIREAAGIVLGSLTSCSAEAIMELQTRNILSMLLLSSNDSSMTVQSTLRGDAAPRCVGIVETVSSILMFAWQHSSGASSELLDRLIEMVDAGVIPYLSKVLSSKIDWDSKDKSVGAMKARTSSCRLLCCLFGVALTDDTGIGMRRLMDAVESDSRSYRGGDRAPSDIIEMSLGVLQTASNYARKALMGTLTQGPHYQTALMDLVDASLLAAGSMCGSSVAPGGVEGTMVTGETFLAARNDQYVGKRRGICRVACDVIVRGGRSGPSLLPTMLVGGFGEASVLSSLRVALAIAQNGSQEEHAKLALSGLLVPISDSLRSALSKGDLYRFSASLAMVRFCGPHIAAGQGGGLESVRDAIRVATNVLTLPINPQASIEQMETQESLKSECIAALESLSHNASLWSAISTEALPSIIQYLHTTAGLKANGNARRQATRSTALKAVLQIVQVPSHAVSAAEAGIVEPLGKLLKAGGGSSSHDNDVSMLALEIVHVVAANPQARKKARFVSTGFAHAICSALAKPDSDDQVAFLGLEILQAILADIEDGLDMQMVFQSADAAAFLDAVASEPGFVRALCATVLAKTNMKLPRHDADQSGESAFEIPKLYGSPIAQIPSKCAGFDGTEEAAASLFYTVSVYACALETKRSEMFWRTVLLRDRAGTYEASECSRLAATMCAHVLALLTSDYQPFVPKDPSKHQDFVAITRPLVRYRLLEALRDLIEDLSNESKYGQTTDPYVISLLVSFNVPHICLSLWKDPAILDLAFQLIKQIVDQEPDEVLHLFVEGKAAIMSLFDLLNLDASFETSQNVAEIRRFLASVLGQLAENGLLTEAVERYDVRSSAIAALAAACISEEERPQDEDEDMTSNRLSSVLMRCLVGLCTVEDGGDDGKKRVQLSASESEAIARNLGKKICQMVLSRFLERAKLQQYEIEEDEHILEAPDVAMLCAIAQHDEALKVLRSVGGLHALSLVAAEGELSAMIALTKACQTDASVLLEGDTYQAVLTLLAESSPSTPELRKLHSSGFEMLGRLCSESAKGRHAVSESSHCLDCIVQAMDVAASVAGLKSEAEAVTVEAEGDLYGSDEDVDLEAAAEPDGLAPTGSSPEKVVDLYSGEDSAKVTGLAELGPDDVDLGSAACWFLSSLVPSKICHETVLGNSSYLAALSSLASESRHDKLRFAAVTVLAALAPYTSSEGRLSADQVAEVLLTVLTSEKKVAATPELNSNVMHRTALTGSQVIFDSISPTFQKSLALASVGLFRTLIKSCSVARATTREHEVAFSAEKAHCLTMILLLARGKEFADEIFTQDLLTSFIHLLQWRYDPKTSIGTTSGRSWDAATATSLLLLSTVIWRPEQALSGAGVSLTTLASTTLMLARPGKAPRKAIDLKAVLVRLSDGPDATLAMAAQRVMDRLF